MDENEQTLYDLALLAYQMEQDRYEWSEEKSERYLAVLAFVVTGTAFGMSEIAAVTAGKLGALQISFLTAVVITAFAAIVALFCAVRALSVEELPFLGLDGELRAFFRSRPREEALPAMTDRFFKGAATLRRLNDRRVDWVCRTKAGINVVLVAGVLAVGLFAALKIREEIVSKTTQSQPSSKPSTPSTRQPTTAPSTSRPIAPDFVPVKKGADQGAVEKR